MKFAPCPCGANEWGHRDPGIEIEDNGQPVGYHCDVCERPAAYIGLRKGSQKFQAFAIAQGEPEDALIDWAYLARMFPQCWESATPSTWRAPSPPADLLIFRGNGNDAWEPLSATGASKAAMA